MKKDTIRTFSVDSNIVNTTAVVRLRRALGAEGFGVYMMLLCRLRVEEGCVAERDYESIAYALAVEPELIRRVVEDFGLFVVTDSGFYSSDIHRQRKIEPADEVAEKATEVVTETVESTLSQTERQQLDRSISGLNIDEEMMQTLCNRHKVAIHDLQTRLFIRFRNYCLVNAIAPERSKDAFALFDDWLGHGAGLRANVG